jgi:hypothetical protein
MEDVPEAERNDTAEHVANQIIPDLLAVESLAEWLTDKSLNPANS